MKLEEYKQKLVRDYTSIKEQFNKSINLTPQQAKIKFNQFVKLIELTNKKYKLTKNAEKRRELDKIIAEVCTIFPDILTIQDEYGENIGMISVEYGLEQAVLVALNNKEASLQQNFLGFNIGMLVVLNGYEALTLKAMQNKEACKQKNIDGDTIESIYQEKFSKTLAY